MNDYCATGQRVASASLVKLPDLALQVEGVVLGHGALSLNRKDPVQVRSRAASEGVPLLGELAIELGQVVLPQNWLAFPPWRMRASRSSCGNFTRLRPGINLPFTQCRSTNRGRTGNRLKNIGTKLLPGLGFGEDGVAKGARNNRLPERRELRRGQALGRGFLLIPLA